MSKTERQKSKVKSAVWITLTVLLSLIALAVIALFSVDIYLSVKYFVVEVSGSSMEQTLQSGDYLYADDKATVERGDIIILSVENHREGTYFGPSTEFIIKRAIGLEGDTVRITDAGAVQIKYAGEKEYTPLSESYISGATAYYDKREWKVGKDEIFFMGDNRADSYDSRRVGCFTQSDVVGVVPQWSVKWKGFSTKWEHFRAIIRGREALPKKGE